MIWFIIWIIGALATAMICGRLEQDLFATILISISWPAAIIIALLYYLLVNAYLLGRKFR